MNIIIYRFKINVTFKTFFYWFEPNENNAILNDFKQLFVCFLLFFCFFFLFENKQNI